MKTVFLGEAKDGKLSLGSDHNAARFRDWLRGNDGKKLRIMEEDKPKRSLSQNRYYRAYLEIIDKETGNNADELHELFKRKFIPARHISPLGEEIRIPGSTRDLSKSEFSDYLDKIAALTEVPLPDPKEMGYETGYRPITKPTYQYPSSEGEITAF